MKLLKSEKTLVFIFSLIGNKLKTSLFQTFYTFICINYKIIDVITFRDKHHGILVTMHQAKSI